MAITIDWPDTKVIYIPKADTQLVQASPEIRQLDVDAFRLILRDLEDDESDGGRQWPITHNHVSPITIGGVTLARVVEIIGGYTVTFEDGQYAVNIVGGNSNIADVTNVNQVSVRSANSAGLTFSEQINNQSFLNATVYIKTDSEFSGTQFPNGVPDQPVNNFDDAYIIATSRNYRSYDLFGSETFDELDLLTGTHFYGHGTLNTTMTFDKTNVQGAVFETTFLSGETVGSFIAVNSLINGLTNFSGNLRECAFVGPITVDPNFTGQILIRNCVSSVAGIEKPVFDMNGSKADLSIRGYIGGFELRGLTEGVNVSFDGLSAEIDIYGTGGTVVVGGDTNYTDYSNGAVTIVTKRRSADMTWNEIIEGEYSAKDLLQVLIAVSAGRTIIQDNSDGTATVRFRDVDDIKDRIVANMEGSERKQITINTD